MYTSFFFFGKWERIDALYTDKNLGVASPITQIRTHPFQVSTLNIVERSWVGTMVHITGPALVFLCLILSFICKLALAMKMWNFRSFTYHIFYNFLELFSYMGILIEFLLLLKIFLNAKCITLNI